MATPMLEWLFFMTRSVTCLQHDVVHTFAASRGFHRFVQDQEDQNGFLGVLRHVDDLQVCHQWGNEIHGRHVWQASSLLMLGAIMQLEDSSILMDAPPLA